MQPNAPAKGSARSGRKLLQWLVAVPLIAALLALLLLDALLLVRRDRYRQETARLRGSMTTLERERADQLTAGEQRKVRIALMLLRRQALAEGNLHLSIAVDSNAMLLEREGALLRQMPVEIGPERSIGSPPDTVRLAVPRGVRTIARVLTADDVWEVPAWVFTDRNLPLPPDTQRVMRGVLGSAAVLLDGGTVIYSLPASGPLADTSYLMPGSIRARPEDLRAILPNLTAGMRAYFY